MSELVVKDLSMSYGKDKVLNDITYKFELGKIYGIFGENGVGKTTFLECICGLLKYNSGTISLDGEKVNIHNISYMSSVFSFYKWMKIKDIIKYYEDFFDDFSTDSFNNYYLLNQQDYNVKLSSLSKGELEFLFLCLTLGREAKIYILDEPFVALDIKLQEDILTKMLKTIKDDVTFIITTHYPSEFQYIFDTVVFMNDGDIVYEENMDSILKSAGSIKDKYMEVITNEF